MRRSYDVVALITGVLFSCVALGALWLTLVGPLPKEIQNYTIYAAGVAAVLTTKPRPA